MRFREFCTEGDVVSFNRNKATDTPSLDSLNDEDSLINHILNPGLDVEDKIDALEKLDQLRGQDSGIVTIRDVQQFIQDAQADGMEYEPPKKVEKPYPDSWVDGPEKPNLKIVK